jgi:hypothetical protein
MRFLALEILIVFFGGVFPPISVLEGQDQLHEPQREAGERYTWSREPFFAPL